MKAVYKLFEDKRTVFVLVIIAFLIRIVIGIFSFQQKTWETFGDNNARKVFAVSILNNGFVPEASNYYRAESIFAPLVPVVIAASIFLFGETWLPLFILNAILGAFSCLIFYKISRIYFNIKISVLVLFWAAVYPNFIRYTGTAGNEPWVVFIFALTFLFALKTIHSEKADHNVLLFALFFVLLLHTDERYISYSLFFTLILFMGQNPIKSKLKIAIVFIMFSALFSMPWLIRNYLYYKDLVLISVRTTNITGKLIDHRDELSVFNHTPQTTHLNQAQIDSVKKGLLTEFPGGISIPEGEIDAIKSGNVPHEFTGIEKVLSRFYFLWVPVKFRENYRITGFDFNPAWSRRHNLFSGLSYGLLLPFMFLAFYNLIKRKKLEIVLMFGGVLLYHTLIHVAFIPYTRDRYRHPVDFIVIILGIYGISIFYNWLKANKIKKKGIIVENG